MKKIDMNLLKEKGWFHKTGRALEPDRCIVSFCDICGCQRLHYLVDYMPHRKYVSFVCGFCNGGVL